MMETRGVLRRDNYCFGQNQPVYLGGVLIARPGSGQMLDIVWADSSGGTG